MADESIYNDTVMGQYLNSLNDDREQRQAVASCIVCGAKYRPAGGPCIHEHPQGKDARSGPVCCLACGSVWQPGHVCVAARGVWRECTHCSALWCALAEVMVPDELEVVTRAMRRVHNNHGAMERAEVAHGNA